MIEDSYSLLTGMKSGIRTAGLVALVGAITIAGVYGCKNVEPLKEDTATTESFDKESMIQKQLDEIIEKEDTATTESFDKESMIQKQLDEIIEREIKKQRGALVALYLDAEDVESVTTEVEYRCYSRGGRRGGYSGIKRIPYRVPWTTWERAPHSIQKEIVIDPGPPHKNFTKVVTLIPGEATNLGHIVLEKVKAEGTASISGIISDESGKPLEGVKISSRKGVVATNAEGVYRIDGFGLEVCELEATKEGYIPYRTKVSIRNMDERIIKQDFVLSYPRKVTFRYVISPKEKDDFNDPNVTSGTAEFSIDKAFFRIPSDQIENEDFRKFVTRVRLSFVVGDGKLILRNFYAPIFYKSLPSSSEQFEPINSVGTLDYNAQHCPPIQEGDIILINGGRVSEYTLKILFEEVQPILPSDGSTRHPLGQEVSEVVDTNTSDTAGQGVQQVAHTGQTICL